MVSHFLPLLACRHFVLQNEPQTRKNWCLNRGIIITTGTGNLFLVAPVSAKPGISQALYHPTQFCTLSIQPTTSQRKPHFTNLPVISKGGWRKERAGGGQGCVLQPGGCWGIPFRTVTRGCRHGTEVPALNTNTQSCCTKSPGDTTKLRAVVLILGGAGGWIQNPNFCLMVFLNTGGDCMLKWGI